MSNMQIDFVIHGVPQGHQVWGTRSDKYYETFYGQYDIYGKTKMVFVVEVRDNNGLRSCYYSLIRPQNILAAGGRKGSYFGMSVRVEGYYCTDVYSLLKLFELTYDQFIANKILVKNGESEQFVYESFEAAKSILTDASKYILSQIQTHLNSEFDEIDDSFTKKNVQITDFYHPDDVNCEAFFNAIKLNGRIIISADYPTKDSIIKSYKTREKQYQDAKKNDDEQIDSLQKEIISLKGYKQKYTGQIKELEDLRTNDQKLKTNLDTATAEIASLKQRNSSLSSQVDQIKDAANIRQIAFTLEKSMSEMLPILRSIAPNPQYDDNDPNYREKKHYNDRNKRITFILMVVILVAILAGIYFFFRARNANTSYSELKKEITTLKMIIASNSKIDLAEYSGTGSLNKDSVYTASITNYKGLGEWQLEGFELIDDSNLNNNIIRVVSHKTGFASLSYKVDGFPVLTRKINVE